MENGSRIVEATLSNIYVIANERASRAKRVGLRGGQFNATRKYCSRQKKFSTVLALDFTCSFHVTFDDLTRRQKNSRSCCEKCMEILVALNFTCSFTWLLMTFVIIINKPSKFGHCSLSSLDWEQSLFFFRFTEGSERERERRATKPREAKNEGGCLSNLASLVRRVVIWYLARFARRTKKKDRLLVVYAQPIHRPSIFSLKSGERCAKFCLGRSP